MIPVRSYSVRIKRKNLEAARRNSRRLKAINELSSKGPTPTRGGHKVAVRSASEGCTPASARATCSLAPPYTPTRAPSTRVTFTQDSKGEAGTATTDVLLQCTSSSVGSVLEVPPVPRRFFVNTREEKTEDGLDPPPQR